MREILEDFLKEVATEEVAVTLNFLLVAEPSENLKKVPRRMRRDTFLYF